MKTIPQQAMMNSVFLIMGLLLEYALACEIMQNTSDPLVSESSSNPLVAESSSNDSFTKQVDEPLNEKTLKDNACLLLKKLREQRTNNDSKLIELLKKYYPEMKYLKRETINCEAMMNHDGIKQLELDIKRTKCYELPAFLKSLPRGPKKPNENVYNYDDFKAEFEGLIVTAGFPLVSFGEIHGYGQGYLFFVSFVFSLYAHEYVSDSTKAIGAKDFMDKMKTDNLNEFIECSYILLEKSPYLYYSIWMVEQNKLSKGLKVASDEELPEEPGFDVISARELAEEADFDELEKQRVRSFFYPAIQIFKKYAKDSNFISEIRGGKKEQAKPEELPKEANFDEMEKQRVGSFFNPVTQIFNKYSNFISEIRDDKKEQVKPEEFPFCKSFSLRTFDEKISFSERKPGQCAKEVERPHDDEINWFMPHIPSLTLANPICSFYGLVQLFTCFIDKPIYYPYVFYLVYAYNSEDPFEGTFTRGTDFYTSCANEIARINHSLSKIPEATTKESSSHLQMMVNEFKALFVKGNLHLIELHNFKLASYKNNETSKFGDKWSFRMETETDKNKSLGSFTLRFSIEKVLFLALENVETSDKSSIDKTEIIGITNMFDLSSARVKNFTIDDEKVDHSFGEENRDKDWEVILTIRKFKIKGKIELTSTEPNNNINNEFLSKDLYENKGSEGIVQSCLNAFPDQSSNSFNSNSIGNFNFRCGSCAEKLYVLFTGQNSPILFEILRSENFTISDVEICESPANNGNDKNKELVFSFTLSSA